MDTRLGANLVDLDYAAVTDKRRLQSQLLHRLFRHASAHPMTRDRVACCSPRAGAEAMFDEWRQIAPITTSDHTPWVRDHRAELAALSQGGTSAIVFSSGGTTGEPKYTYLSLEEVLRNTRYHGKGYRLAGVRESDLVATFGLPATLSSEFTVYHGLQQTGCSTLPIGKLDPELIIDLCARLSVTAILSMPSNLAPVLAALERSGRSLPGVRLVVTGGEAMPEALRERTRRVLQPEVAFRSTFQTSDVGTIGYQCEHCEDGVFHVHEGMQYVETVPSDEVEHASELVVTNLDRYLMPVIRMKTGDLVTLDEGGCRCGRTAAKLRLLGRGSRYRKLGGEKLDAAVFEEMARLLDLQLDEIAVTIQRDTAGRDRLLIALSARALGDVAGCARARALLYERCEKLRSQIDAGTVAPIELTALDPSELLFSQSGKRILVSDRRAHQGVVARG